MEVPHPGPPVERIREVYVDRPKPVEVEVLREVPIEVVKEVPVEGIQEVTREVLPQSRPPPQEQAPRRPSKTPCVLAMKSSALTASLHGSWAHMAYKRSCGRPRATSCDSWCGEERPETSHLTLSLCRGPVSARVKL